MNLYLDASALVKRYLSEPGSLKRGASSTRQTFKARPS
jgi:predicted nucleic acid-binding protein